MFALKYREKTRERYVVAGCGWLWLLPFALCSNSIKTKRNKNSQKQIVGLVFTGWICYFWPRKLQDKFEKNAFKTDSYRKFLSAGCGIFGFQFCNGCCNAAVKYIVEHSKNVKFGAISKWDIYSIATHSIPATNFIQCNTPFFVYHSSSNNSEGELF